MIVVKLLRRFGFKRSKVFADRVTQFGERGSFQLPNALTRYANYLSHLLKRLCRRARSVRTDGR
jgi:hypothetical protein